MNSKILFALSLIVIAIGGYGLMNKPSAPSTSVLPQGAQTGKEKIVKVAVTTHNIDTSQILTGSEYEIKMQKVSDDFDEKFILKEKNFNGYLTRMNISSGIYLTSDMLIAPSDPEFSSFNFKEGALPYYFPVDKKNEYLLSVVSPGKKVTILLKYKKAIRKTATIINSSETGQRVNNKELTNIVITPVMVNIPVIAVNYPKKVRAGISSDLDTSQEGEKQIASIILKMSSDQFAKINLLKDAGELIISPEGSGTFFTEKSMNVVFPEWDSQIREIRGRK